MTPRRARTAEAQQGRPAGKRGRPPGSRGKSVSSSLEIDDAADVDGAQEVPEKGNVRILLLQSIEVMVSQPVVSLEVMDLSEKIITVSLDVFVRLRQGERQGRFSAASSFAELAQMHPCITEILPAIRLAAPIT